MSSKQDAHYEKLGVLTNDGVGLTALLRALAPTERLRDHAAYGRPANGNGFFARVIKLGDDLGLALTTDGVGSKTIVAQLLDRYDSIGIDCIAMNVNDLICVGAEPIAMLDYIGVEQASPRVLEEIGKGLAEGARQAGVALVGGEISQLPEMIRGVRPGTGLDLVGMCVGTVKLSQLNEGQSVAPGDVVIGLRSSGVHSNGFTLARDALFAKGRLEPGSYAPELGRSVGDELIEPTTIYVRPVLDLLASGTPIKGLANITSDGLLNLARLQSKVGYRLTSLPEPQPIFRLIQRLGDVPEAEMYRVFNMGVGFCVVVAPGDVAAVERVLAKHETPCQVIGEVVPDDRARVFMPQQHLVGEGDWFVPDERGSAATP